MSDCQKCTKYRKFIMAMIVEFGKYGQNKTAQYYKGQCEKVLVDAGTDKEDSDG